MKTITIGRDAASNVFIDDPMISRHHALLRIHPTGKMELVDMSSNGTYVNRVKLASNVPFPLTRKDTVSFAGVRQLDWKLIPHPLAWVKWVLLGVCSVVVLIVAISMLSKCSSSNDSFVDSVGTSSGSSVEGGSSSRSVSGSSSISDSSETGAKEVGNANDKEKLDAEVKEEANSKSWHEKEVDQAKKEVETKPRKIEKPVKQKDGKKPETKENIYDPTLL